MYRLAWVLLATLAVVRPVGAETAHATFAGGCFWCMVPPFETLDGVVSVTSGYTGGTKVNPTYEEVSAGGTGHAESVEIVYDPARIGYEKLLDVFWHNVDPTTPEAQFCDHGNQYRSAIFYHDDAQQRLAEESKQALERSHALPGPDRDRDRGRRTVLPGGGVSPGLLQEESDPVPLLPLHLRPRSAPPPGLGRSAGALSASNPTRLRVHADGAADRRRGRATAMRRRPRCDRRVACPRADPCWRR